MSRSQESVPFRSPCPATAMPGGQPAGPAESYSHVLLLSLDGMHQSDLRWYVARHPDSALASLLDSGTSFTRARTPFPSDSFPGTTRRTATSHSWSASPGSCPP